MHTLFLKNPVKWSQKIVPVDLVIGNLTIFKLVVPFKIRVYPGHHCKWSHLSLAETLAACLVYQSARLTRTLITSNSASACTEGVLPPILFVHLKVVIVLSFDSELAADSAGGVIRPLSRHR